MKKNIIGSLMHICLLQHLFLSRSAYVIYTSCKIILYIYPPPHKKIKEILSFTLRSIIISISYTDIHFFTPSNIIVLSTIISALHPALPIRIPVLQKKLLNWSVKIVLSSSLSCMSVFLLFPSINYNKLLKKIYYF